MRWDFDCEFGQSVCIGELGVIPVAFVSWYAKIMFSINKYFLHEAEHEEWGSSPRLPINRGIFRDIGERSGPNLGLRIRYYKSQKLSRLSQQMSLLLEREFHMQSPS